MPNAICRESEQTRGQSGTPFPAILPKNVHLSLHLVNQSRLQGPIERVT